MTGQQVIAVPQGGWQSAVVKFVYEASKTRWQVVFYIALWFILYLVPLLTLGVVSWVFDFNVNWFVTPVLLFFGVTALVLKLAHSSLVWLTSDEILVIELPLLKGKMVAKKLNIPEVTGETVGTMWQTQNEIPYDAGFVPRRGAFALIPWWGIEYTRLAARVRLITVDETITMQPEPAVIAVPGQTGATGTAARQVQVKGAFRWTPISELAGSFVGKVGKNCEREGEMETLLRTHAVNALRSVITSQNLSSVNVGQARGDLALAFEKSFGNPDPLATDPELYLVPLEIEYGVTTGDFNLTDVAVVGSEKDADALRQIAEQDARRLQRQQEDDALGIRRDREFRQTITDLTLDPTLDSAAKGKILATFQQQNGSRPAPVAGAANSNP